MMSGSIDLELKKAFSDLQQKMIETQQKFRSADMQIEVNKQTVKKSELCKSELKSLEPSTPTYQAIGRMFLKQTLPQSVEMLDNRIKAAKDKISSLESHKAYLERNMKDAESNLREMIQSRKSQS